MAIKPRNNMPEPSDDIGNETPCSEAPAEPVNAIELGEELQSRLNPAFKDMIEATDSLALARAELGVETLRILKFLKLSGAEWNIAHDGHCFRAYRKAAFENQHGG